MTDWDKLLKQTTCDICNGKVEKGNEIYAASGFYHRDCWDNHVKEVVNSYKGKESDLNYTSEVVCPWCGNVNRNSWELPDNDGITTCGFCETDFKYERVITVEYCTNKILEGAKNV